MKFLCFAPCQQFKIILSLKKIIVELFDNPIQKNMILLSIQKSPLAIKDLKDNLKDVAIKD